jgi:hypothetical protein
MTREELLIEYKWIFEMYRKFGDDLRLELERRLQRPLPGWYDTHATFRRFCRQGPSIVPDFRAFLYHIKYIP